MMPIGIAQRRLAALLLVSSLVLPQPGHAAALNLAAVSCAKYENHVLASNDAATKADPIDTVMWLFGFSVARSGERSMYGDSLSAFGFALDAECKDNPTSTLLEAVMAVKSKRQNPMDLTQLKCSTFETRHVALRKSDPEGANTLTMWLLGYATGLSNKHVLDADSLTQFDAALDEHCTQHPEDTLFDALSPAQPASSPPQRRKR